MKGARDIRRNFPRSTPPVGGAHGGTAILSETPEIYGIEHTLTDDMDINCGGILDGSKTMQQMGQEIFQNLLRTVSGEKTRSEILGLGDHEFVPWNIGVTG